MSGFVRSWIRPNLIFFQAKNIRDDLSYLFDLGAPAFRGKRVAYKLPITADFSRDVGIVYPASNEFDSDFKWCHHRNNIHQK